MSLINIGVTPIGNGSPTFVIAELAWSHDGDLDKAIRIARGAAQAGANALSVHVTSLPDYMVRHYGNPDSVSAGKPSSEIYSYLDKINLSFDAVDELSRVVRASGLELLMMPNDFASLEFCCTLNPQALVLAPACFIEKDFVCALGKAGKPVVLRVGGATLGEIECALGWLTNSGASEFLLLHGFQTYPTHLEETNLRVIPMLIRTFGCLVGLADHLDGGYEMALTVPPLALALGAAALEKHITWDRSECGEDFEAALDPKQFARFVQILRSGEKALGAQSIPSFSDGVLKYRHVSRKRVVAAASLPAGTCIERHHLVCKRSDEGAAADELIHFIGRCTKAALEKDAPVTFSVVT